MKNSYKYFENRECQYFPCHKGTTEFNCLFCYCPLYHNERCPGTPEYIEINDKRIKDCSNCIFPHQADNYEKILKMMN